MQPPHHKKSSGPKGLDPSTGEPLVGLLNVDKPLRLSSMSVVSVVRRRAGGAKTGHAGTLDPLATGVLLVCVGKPATRAVDRFMGMPKRYRATVDLSSFTSTDDAEGEREVVVPPDDPEHPAIPSIDAIRAACDQWTGRIMQAPPAFSAIKVGGRRAYRMARRGEEVDLPARPIEIHSIEIVDYAWPGLVIDVHCGKGTYIRSLARDLGRTLGVGGHLTSLRRTAIGEYAIEDAIVLDDVPDALHQSDLLPLPPALTE